MQLTRCLCPLLLLLVFSSYLQPAPVCQENAWSLSYTQDFWRESFCTGGRACSRTKHSACDMQVPAFGSMAANLHDVLLATGCTFTTSGNADVTRNQMCSCIAKYGEVGNSVAYVFNVLLASTTISKPAQPMPNTCSGAAYVPVAEAYVCTKPGSSSSCPCPSGPVSTWDRTASNACRAFLFKSTDDGKCLPAVHDDKMLSRKCQVQSCECEQPGPLPSPSPSPTPTPTPSPSPSPDQPGPLPSPSPSPDNCTPSNNTWAEFSESVDGSAIVSVEYGGNTVGYFRHTITDCDPETNIMCSGSTYNGQPGVWEVCNQEAHESSMNKLQCYKGAMQ